MNPEHLTRLCADFDLGEVQKIEENHEGVLNKNYLLLTSKGSYFIKSVRESKQESISHIATVEKFMHDKGIPAVCMLRSKGDELFTKGDTELYTVYPYLESNRSHSYSTSDFHTMGEMLGRIHRAGSGTLPASLPSQVFSEKSMEQVLAKLTGYEKEIHGRANPSDTDLLFLSYIRMKLRIIQTLEPISLSNDTLVHGDYHARNLLIDSSRVIVGICDWEKAELAPRSHELARSIQYTCFEEPVGGNEVNERSNDAAIQQSRSFLEGYREAYAISDEEIMLGFKLRYRKIATSFWIEDFNYLHGDTRSNKFIPHEMMLLTEFASGDLARQILQQFQSPR